MRHCPTKVSRLRSLINFLTRRYYIKGHDFRYESFEVHYESGWATLQLTCQSCGAKTEVSTHQCNLKKFENKRRLIR